VSPLLIKISKDFATIWTTIDPIGNVALFAALTALLTRADAFQLPRCMVSVPPKRLVICYRWRGVTLHHDAISIWFDA